MKTLGILGGMGPMASQLLYQTITQRTLASCDQEHLNIFLYSHASLPDRTQAIQQGYTQEIREKLVADVQLLEKMGAQVLAIPCNTSHYFYQDMAKALSIPLLNMVQLTAQTVAQAGHKKVAILSTEGTQFSKLYETAFQEYAIQTVDIPCFLQEKVNYLIYDVVKQGATPSWSQFEDIHQFLLGQELDQVVLACTELSVFGSIHPLPSFYVDALHVLAQAAITHCGGTVTNSRQNEQAP